MINSKKISFSFCLYWQLMFFSPLLFLFREVGTPCLFLMFNHSKGRQGCGSPFGIQKEILHLIVDVCAKQFCTNDNFGYCLQIGLLSVVPHVT